MAINIKDLFADALLQLLHTNTLSSITISMLLEKTGASRQTFYNHFKDKNDLICYIYDTKIIPDYSTKNISPMDFTSSLYISLENMKQYKQFMQQALRIEEAGCLKDYMMLHCEQFDMQWHQMCYGDTPMPEALVFASKYHATASSSMTISWVLSGMRVDTKEMVEMIVKMRAIGMDTLFENGKMNPYK